jgi:Fe-Mn family superoxide dismutase
MTPHCVPPLPYDWTALQPWIDEQTLRLHYEHHRARVDALNAAESQLVAQRDNADFAWLRYLQRLVAIRASEHLMHCLFWQLMGPNQGGAPGDALADQIHDDFGSFATFKSQFAALATTPETGEWVALVWRPTSGRLAIRSVDYHQLPCEWGMGILLALDVGEHAYYLQYQNRRAEYAHNWWNIVNWPRVAERFAAATHPWTHTPAASTTSRPQPRRRYRHALPVCVDGGYQFPRSADPSRRPR